MLFLTSRLLVLFVQTHSNSYSRNGEFQVLGASEMYPVQKGGRVEARARKEWCCYIVCVV
jgi:hypothetical protein